jgi:Tfp pilus assembly protein PilZ
MAEKRIQPRHRKRFSLRFTDLEGTNEGANRLSFTEDISRCGIFIKTAYVIRPGSRVEILLTLPAGEVRLQAKVRWAKKVQASFLHRVSKAGMGVLITEFLEGEELYTALLDELDKG